MAKDGLFPKNHWSRPDIDPQRKGDPTPLELYMAVGAASSAWEQVEENLARLALVFSRVTDARSLNAVRHIFGSIESSSVRLNVLSTLAAILWPLLELPRS